MAGCGGKRMSCSESEKPDKRRPWWCIICGSDEDDELKYGQLCETKKYNVHFFCLLLSGTFEQRGRDNEGVYGFLLKDIDQGLKLIKDVICWYCGLPNASIYCSKTGCRRVFHLTCGVESGCLSEFLGGFNSYCHRHNAEFRYRDYKEEACVICRDPFRFANDVVQNDCCKGHFHRRCLGSLALSSGYFFKCPLCNNQDAFRKCMRQKGIYVPDRDAAWELEENAFNDLYTPSIRCEAKTCLSSRGRQFNSVGAFAFMSCSSCGAGSIHRKCCDSPDYLCEICTSLYTRNNTTVGGEGHRDASLLSSSMLINLVPLSQSMIRAEAEAEEGVMGSSGERDEDEGASEKEQEDSISSRRRRRRQVREIAQIRRDADTPSSPVSPFKTRPATRRHVGGTPKRRRIH